MRFQLEVRRFPEDKIMHYLVDGNRIILDLEGEGVRSSERKGVEGHRVMGSIEVDENADYNLGEYCKKLETGSLLVLKGDDGLYVTSDVYYDMNVID
tara:strand:- start:615 stop:905 length:291 start_codon:yes stop_codon:yes gene_type:complete